MTRVSFGVLGLVVGLVACGEPAEVDEVPDDGIELLSARQRLIRLSVDLRGIHPSEEELAFIEEYPDAYEEFVDRYLYDPRFVKRVKEMFNYSFLTRTGETYFDPSEAGLGLVDEDRVADAIADEPLELIAWIVDNDLPYSEVVTADYAMADPLVAAMWDMDYSDDDRGWVQTRYADGRPMSGVLSSTTMWSRYPSAGVNSNRHRANTVSRIFLCDDYLSRPVSFARSQIDALTGGDPNDVIAGNGVCQSCHATLDPLAAHFYGFWWEIEGDLAEQTLYRPEDEEMWRYNSGKSPAYYGVPTSSLTELGQRLANDQRFAQCATKTVFEGLTQRTTDDVDWTELAAHQATFEDSGLVVRDLLRSIVLSRTYQAANISDEELNTRVPTVKTTTPAQLADIIADKTGYRWTFSGRDGLSRNALGLTVLAGGIDSRFVTTPSHDPSVGTAFVQERLAQAAGWHVAQHDLDADREEDAILLKYVTIEDDPAISREAFAAQIEYLYLSVTGLPLDRPEPAEDAKPDDPPPEAPEVEELIGLWKELYSVNASATRSWAGIVSVVLRDPRVLFY